MPIDPTAAPVQSLPLIAHASRLATSVDWKRQRCSRVCHDRASRPPQGCALLTRIRVPADPKVGTTDAQSLSLGCGTMRLLFVVIHASSRRATGEPPVGTYDT